MSSTAQLWKWGHELTFFSSFKAIHYRGIDGLSFPHLAKANLVTGVNGIGKTAVIEAMWLFAERYNALLLWSPNVQRSNRLILNPIAKLTDGVLELEGIENESTHRLKATFERAPEISNLEGKSIEISTKNRFVEAPTVAYVHTELHGNFSKTRSNSMLYTPLGKVEVSAPGFDFKRPNSVILSTKFQHETSKEHLQRYSDMVNSNYKDDFKNAINLIFPKITDVGILIDEMGEPYLSATMDDGVQLPFHDLGGGIVRLYQLFLGFFTSRGGTLFSDEVENGLHHSVLKDVWAHGRTWMHQWNVQLVATTHSAECIDAAIAAFEDAPDDLAIHKLFRNEKTGRVEATTFTGETLEGVRDLGLEIR